MKKKSFPKITSTYLMFWCSALAYIIQLESSNKYYSANKHQYKLKWHSRKKNNENGQVAWG